MKTVRHEAEKDLEFWTKRVKEPGYVYVIQGDPGSPRGQTEKTQV